VKRCPSAQALSINVASAVRSASPGRSQSERRTPTDGTSELERAALSDRPAPYTMSHRWGCRFTTHRATWVRSQATQCPR